MTAEKVSIVNSPEEGLALIPEVLPADGGAYVLPEMTLGGADPVEIDRQITCKIEECANQLALKYWELGRLLNWMRDNKRYKKLGFDNWQAYLDSKRSEFGRSYQHYLVKLGQIENIEKYLQTGMSGTKLIEFIKKAPEVKDVTVLLEAQWEAVKNKSVRDTGQILEKYVAEHPNDFQRSRPHSGAGRPKLDLNEKLKNQYDKITNEVAKANFIAEVEKFLSENRPAVKKGKGKTASLDKF